MKVLLTTLHSKFIHASLALPYLAASCSNVKDVEIVINEFTIKEPLDGVVSSLKTINPDVVGFSCYIWNIEKTLSFLSEMKREKPETFVVLGGPEVSHDAENILKRNEAINCIVKGEGETTFKNILETVSTADNTRTCQFDLRNVAGVCFRKGSEIIDNGMAPAVPLLDKIPSPFLSGLVEVRKPLVYYESSRGCPFTCAFCLASLDNRVRSFSMERIEQDLLSIIHDGVKQVKFVDRTFNYDTGRANKIWEFILEHNRVSRFHFEIAADLLSSENIEMLKNVPPDTFRFEIGVQSLAEKTLNSVGRNTNMSKLFFHAKRLIEETNVYIHLDLVAGLPGEDYSGFLASLQRLFATRSHHVQVEPLKVLKGAPMMGIAKKEGYVFSGAPPYRIITTPWLSTEEIDGIDTVGRLLELVYNSGRFRKTLDAIEERTPLSEFFGGLAQYWRRAKIETLSLEGLFETLWTFAKNKLSADHLFLFTDALSYDRCMANYPTVKRLPPYMSRDANDCRVNRRELGIIRKALNIVPHMQVNAIRYRFARDYGSGKHEHLFIYLSSDAKKLEVVVKQADEIFKPT